MPVGEDLPVRKGSTVSDRLCIREAREDDAGRLAVLSTQLGYPSSEEDVLRRFNQIKRFSRHAFYVAETAKGLVVGWLYAYVVVEPESDMRAEIGGLVVDESWRGSGAGKLLMGQAELWARETGCRSVSLYSNSARRGAHEFYKDIGYTHYKTSLRFRKALSNHR